MEWEQYVVQGSELLYLCAGVWFDIKEQKLPVWFLRIFIMLAICCNVFLKYQNFREVLAGCILGAIFLFIGWLSKEAIGYGDGIALLTLGIFEGGMQMIADLDVRTANLQLMFSLLLTVAFVVAKFL